MRIGRKRKTVGLALGAGAARGCAHLGVIDALEEAGVPIDFVAGTSIGALVGGVYASGNLDALRQSLLQLEWKEILYYFFDFAVPRGGLIDGKRVVEFIREYVQDTEIQDLPICFRAVATDIHTGREVQIGEGLLMEAIRCSIAIPGIFTPVMRGSAALVDGGLVNPVPVSVVRDMGADFVIRPPVGHISFMEFNKAAEVIRAGHEAAVPELEGVLKRIGPQSGRRP